VLEVAIRPSFNAGVGWVSTACWASRLTTRKLFDLSALKIYKVLDIKYLHSSCCCCCCCCRLPRRFSRQSTAHLHARVFKLVSIWKILSGIYNIYCQNVGQCLLFIIRYWSDMFRAQLLAIFRELGSLSTPTAYMVT
jgi:hypothetical protein